MTTPELQAAAARLRQTPPKPGWNLDLAQAKDVATLAEWAALLLDEEPIDGEFLIGCGFSTQTAVNRDYQGRMFRMGRIELQLPEGYVTIDDNDYGNEWTGLERRFQTRGAVRTLLAALRPPATPQPPETTTDGKVHQKHDA